MPNIDDKVKYHIACIIPTFNGGPVWAKCIDSIYKQSIKADIVYIVDSSSCDNTIKIAQSYGSYVTNIAPSDFNHGGTRNMAAKNLAEYDILIFLTQDAILASQDALMHLITPFVDPAVAAVCGRQLPHDNANPLAIHARLFNYPVDSCAKSAADIPRLGIKTAFMSNSFAAYRSKVFFELGGFPDNTILAEDMYLTAKMIKAGYKVAYCAEAAVKHSHNYTPWEEFRRYFDTGVFHASEPWIREQFGGAEGEGMRFIRSELFYLWQNAPYWIPRALLTIGCKALGYKLGLHFRKLPWNLRHKLGMYKAYWLQNRN